MGRRKVDNSAPTAGDFAGVLLPILLLLSPLIAFVFYILSYRKTAVAVNAAGGNAPVNSAWLLLVPLLGYAWFFVLLIQLKDAITKSGRNTDNSQWWIFGMIAGGLFAIATFALLFKPDLIGLLGFNILVFAAWAVFAVLHWVKLVGLREHFK